MVLQVTMVILSILALTYFSCQQTMAACHIADYSREAVIRKMGGVQTQELLRVYRAEGRHCYIGNHGSSFGPFQLHYATRSASRGNRGAGLGDVFTKKTGLNARDPNTVPAQITFMRQWGRSHGGFSSKIWHGLHRRNLR